MVYVAAIGVWILDKLWGEKASSGRYARKWARKQDK